MQTAAGAADTVYSSSFTCAQAQTSLRRITTKLHCEKPRWSPRKTCFVGCCGFTCEANFTVYSSSPRGAVGVPRKVEQTFWGVGAEGSHPQHQSTPRLSPKKNGSPHLPAKSPLSLSAILSLARVYHTAEAVYHIGYSDISYLAIARYIIAK